MVASAIQVPLKVKTDSKFYQFLEWFETAKTEISNPETGRKRKGNYRKFILEEFEKMLNTGKPSNELIKTLEEFKQSSFLSPELQVAKQNLDETDFAKLVELMDKAKRSPLQ